jgi:hypothetical protein
MRKVVALLFAASIAAGCILVTGGTDGYYARDAGRSSVCSDGGEGGCPALACVSAVDCGDGGAVCCLVTNTSVGIGTACQESCGGAFPVQLCRTNAECGDAGPCGTQSCSVGGSSFVLEVCGMLAGCTGSP